MLLKPGARIFLVTPTHPSGSDQNELENVEGTLLGYDDAGILIHTAKRNLVNFYPWSAVLLVQAKDGLDAVQVEQGSA